MKIVKPQIIVPNKLTQYKLDNPNETIEFLANGARIAYQSFEKKNGIETEERLIKSCIKSGHTSVLEHESLTFDFITSRSIANEMVRHRIASYVQESTRYVKYEHGEMEFIRPNFRNTDIYDVWVQNCFDCEAAYNSMREAGAQAQEAREVLNNSFKTHIRVTRNFRAMREFLSLRCAKSAHPHIKELCIPLLLLMKQKFPVIFDDIKYDEEFLEYMDPWGSYIKEFVIPVKYLEEGEH